jgi:hypothetical protein
MCLTKIKTMKQLIQLTVIFLLAGFIFSSCNSNLSITKRRYNKGYYVHNQKAPVNDHNKVAKAEKNKTAAKDKFYEPVGKGDVKSPADPAVAKSAIVTAEAAKAANSVKSDRASKMAAPVELAVKHPLKAVNTAGKLIRERAATEGDALSLLWVVIVVILILYLLGLLFDGFGLPGTSRWTHPRAWRNCFGTAYPLAVKDHLRTDKILLKR